MNEQSYESANSHLPKEQAFLQLKNFITTELKQLKSKSTFQEQEYGEEHPLWEIFKSHSATLDMTYTMLVWLMKIKKPWNVDQVVIGDTDLDLSKCQRLYPACFTSDDNTLQFLPFAFLEQHSNALPTILTTEWPNSILCTLLAITILQRAQENTATGIQPTLCESERVYIRQYCGENADPTLYQTSGNMNTTQLNEWLTHTIKQHIEVSHKKNLEKQYAKVSKLIEKHPYLAIFSQTIQKDKKKIATYIPPRDDQRNQWEQNHVQEIYEMLDTYKDRAVWINYLDTLFLSPEYTNLYLWAQQILTTLKEHLPWDTEAVQAYIWNSEDKMIPTETQARREDGNNLSEIIRKLIDDNIIIVPKKSKNSSNDEGNEWNFTEKQTYESELKNNEEATNILKKMSGRPDLDFDSFGVGNEIPPEGEQSILIESIEPPLYQNLRGGIFEVQQHTLQKVVDWKIIQSKNTLPPSPSATHIYTLAHLSTTGWSTLPLPLWASIADIYPQEDSTKKSLTGTDALAIKYSPETGLYHIKANKQITGKVHIWVSVPNTNTNTWLGWSYLELQKSSPLSRNNTPQEITPWISNTQKAEAIRSYIWENCYYGFNKDPKMPQMWSNIPGYLQQLIDYYKQNTETGYDGKLAIICNQSALIAAVMLQQQGVPARVVSGMTGWSKVEWPGHAWIEYRDGATWISMDPTPSATPPTEIARLLYPDKQKKETTATTPGEGFLYDKETGVVSFDGRVIDLKNLRKVTQAFESDKNPELKNATKCQEYIWYSAYRVSTIDSVHAYGVCIKDGQLVVENITLLGDQLDEYFIVSNMIKKILNSSQIYEQTVVSSYNSLTHFLDLQQALWITPTDEQKAYQENIYRNIYSFLTVWNDKKISQQPKDVQSIFEEVRAYLQGQETDPEKKKLYEYEEREILNEQEFRSSLIAQNVVIMPDEVDKVLTDQIKRAWYICTEIRKNGQTSYELCKEWELEAIRIYSTSKSYPNRQWNNNLKNNSDESITNVIKKRYILNPKKNIQATQQSFEQIYVKELSSSGKQLLEEIEVALPLNLSIWYDASRDEFGDIQGVLSHAFYDGILKDFPISTWIEKDKIWLLRNNMRKIPETIWNNDSLKLLRLDWNNLEVIPEQIWNLSNLEKLDLSENYLSTLSNIHKLQKLSSLRIANNQFTEIPEQVFALSNLKLLNVSENQISKLPKEIDSLKNLESLILWDNELTDLPPTLSHLTKLRHLSVQYNKLKFLPNDLVILENLTNLYIGGNPDLWGAFTVRSICEVDFGEFDERSKWEKTENSNWTVTYTKIISKE
jgi:Leucine rich repeat/Transglutaminase-like superfamily